MSFRLLLRWVLVLIVYILYIIVWALILYYYSCNSRKKKVTMGNYLFYHNIRESHRFANLISIKNIQHIAVRTKPEKNPQKQKPLISIPPHPPQSGNFISLFTPIYFGTKTFINNDPQKSHYRLTDGSPWPIVE